MTPCRSTASDRARLSLLLVFKRQSNGRIEKNPSSDFASAIFSFYQTYDWMDVGWIQKWLEIIGVLYIAVSPASLLLSDNFTHHKQEFITDLFKSVKTLWNFF